MSVYLYFAFAVLIIWIVLRFLKSNYHVVFILLLLLLTTFLVYRTVNDPSEVNTIYDFTLGNISEDGEYEETNTVISSKYFGCFGLEVENINDKFEYKINFYDDNKCYLYSTEWSDSNYENQFILENAYAIISIRSKEESKITYFNREEYIGSININSNFDYLTKSERIELNENKYKFVCEGMFHPVHWTYIEEETGDYLSDVIEIDNYNTLILRLNKNSLENESVKLYDSTKKETYFHPLDSYDYRIIHFYGEYVYIAIDSELLEKVVVCCKEDNKDIIAVYLINMEW